MTDSSNSSELSLRVGMDTMEFTLEDTLGLLKELKLERDEALERRYDVHINNQRFTPLNQSVNILDKQHQLTLSFLNEISKEKPDDYPIPNSIDTFTNLIRELVEEIDDVEGRIDTATQNLKCKEENIKRLEERNKGFEEMKEACLAANENIASKTYKQEIQITNQIFEEVRRDTQQVTAELFSNDDHHMKDFLALLCSAYFTGDNDVYIDLEPEFTDASNFLLEAGIVVCHKYDKNKVRLVDLL